MNNRPKQQPIYSKSREDINESPNELKSKVTVTVQKIRFSNADNRRSDELLLSK